MIKAAIVGSVLALSLGGPSVQTPSSNSGTWAQYLPQKERQKVYEKAVSRRDVRSMASSGISRDTGWTREVPTMITCLWVTEPVARAIASWTVEKKSADATQAERTYRSLRSTESFLVIVTTDGAPLANTYTQPKIVLLLDKLTRVVAGTLIEPSFDIPQLHNRGPEAGRWLVAFPRVGSDGTPTIASLAHECRIQLQYSGRIVEVPIKLDKIVIDVGQL
jgi:hypothetical protein